MSKFTSLLLFSAVFGFLVSQQLVSARILSKCEAVKTMIKSKVDGTFLRTYTCIMMHESKFDTKKYTGPGHKASFSHGVFQISSDYWCNRWRADGHCKKKCSDFLDDDIRDDIECAKTIQKIEGFKRWKSFNTTCKNIKNHPSIEECKSLLTKAERKWLEEILNSESEEDESSVLFSGSDDETEELNFN